MMEVYHGSCELLGVREWERRGQGIVCHGSFIGLFFQFISANNEVWGDSENLGIKTLDEFY